MAEIVIFVGLFSQGAVEINIVDPTYSGNDVFCQLFKKTLAEKTNANVTQATKVGAHVKTCGWGNQYLIV